MKLISLAGLTLALLLQIDPAPARPLIIEQTTLIDGSGREPVANASLLISDGTIRRIIRGSFPPQQRRGAEVIDGRGKYLIPGLMDIHVHLRGGTEVTSSGLRKIKVNKKDGIQMLHSYLYSGVTAIYDMGNNPDYIFALRQEERAGKLLAPRIFTTGSIVTHPGSHGSGPGAVLIDRWPEGKPALDAHIRRAPDMVKLTYEERGWGARPAIPLLPLDIMQNIVEYYNDQGIRSTVHASSERRARQAIFAGVDTLAHPVIQGPTTEEFARLVSAKRIPMATTLTIGENYSRLAQHPEYLDQALYQAVLSQAEIARLKTQKSAQYKQQTWTWWMQIMTPVAQQNLRMIHDQGGILALGTDQSMGPAVHREMELLAAAGIPNLAIIRIATLNAAVFLGREAQLGSLAEGKLADMVLLNKNPVEDIDNAKDIAMVFKQGASIDRSRLHLPINDR